MVKPRNGVRDKAVTARRRNAKSSKSGPDSGVCVASLQAQLDQRTHELREARRLLLDSLEQQTATSEVLGVMSSTPGDLEPVFEAILVNATRICEANFGNLMRYEDGVFRVTALHGANEEWAAARRREPVVQAGVNHPFTRVIRTKRLLHIADMRQDEAYLERDPSVIPFVEKAGARTNLIVPMLKEDRLVGAIAIYRHEVRPFTDKQIELVQNFAAQAVIAIENTRLLSELRQRTDDLSEALEQQTATSEVLKVISRSPTQLQPVLDAIVNTAARLCAAGYSYIARYEENGLRYVAHVRVSDEHLRFLADSINVDRGAVIGRVVLEQRTVHVPDVLADPEFDRFEWQKVGKQRTVLGVPLLREGTLIGVIILARTSVAPFTKKQIELVTAFADQAVIAIENARLFDEVQARTRELSESLEQQTATSEVLRVISSSPGELEPVFQAMLENAIRICEAGFGTLFRFDGEFFLRAASLGAPPALAEFQAQPIRVRPGSLLDEILQTKEAAHVADDAAGPTPSAPARLGGARSTVAVPMLKDDHLVGAIVIYRREVRPFTDKQIELLTNFAAQAVIAIENTRLLSELREALQQQTATADVLKVISRSPGDLEPVFTEMLENATRICEAKYGILHLYDESGFHPVVRLGVPPALAKYHRQNRSFRPAPGSNLDLLVQSKDVVHIADDAASPSPGAPAKLAGARSTLVVPMLKENELIGAFSIYRQEVRPFTDKQIELLSNFAAQAVIAIENTRLLSELRQSLQQQTATADVLKTISRSTFDLQTVLDTLVESVARLCEADMASINRQKGDGFYEVASHGLSPEHKQMVEQRPLEPGRGSIAGRTIQECAVVHVADVLADPEYKMADIARVGGNRTMLGVPLLLKEVPIGTITLMRRKVRPFTDRQIELVQTFADQAVIAIENVRLFEDLQKRTEELSESLEQQTATSDVLKVISSSPGDLAPVFQAMLDNATRICGAKFGVLFLAEGDGFRSVAMQGLPPAHLEERQREPVIHPVPADPLSRLMRTKQIVHIADLREEEAYIQGYPPLRAVVDAGGGRTLLAVPMLKENEVIGVLGVYRQQVQPFIDKQIELVKNFAAQAVIAIENTRLLNELRESLQQQTATADVLKVISRSTFDLQVVLDTLAESAVRLCDADQSVIRRRAGDVYPVAATCGFSPQQRAHLDGYSPRPDRGSIFGRTLIEGRTIHVPDVIGDPEWNRPNQPAATGIRAAIGVPLLREGTIVGTLVVTRSEPRAFSDKQIELLETFADQAVIAIENVRLFDEVQARTEELSESLEQQTATSEVLRVISSAPGDVQPVFEVMLANATRLCDAKFGTLYLCEGDVFRIVAMHGAPPAFAEERLRNPVIHPAPGTVFGRTVSTKQVAQIADIREEADHIAPSGRTGTQLAALAGARSVVAVPMVKDNELVGAILIFRQEVKPFSDKQIELVQNFAAQAVIAIENTRLLNELRQRTDELARSVGELQALGEVSQAVNSTLDLETVLTTIVQRAVQLSRTDAGAIYVFDEGRQEFRLRATYGMSEAMIVAITDRRIGLADANIGRAASKRAPMQVADMQNEPSSPVNDIVLREGYRALLIIPLLRPDHIVGALVVRRKAPGEFPQSTIDLLQTFADQSVVAIQNARLFESVEARTRELARSLEDLRTAQDRLIQTEKLASLGQLTAGIAHEIKNPLNFVNNFSAVSVELIDELRQALSSAHLDNKLRTEVGEIADMLQGNLDKVVQHGKRADSIVKNMLLHSREGSGEHRPVDINALVEESLNLAYHGARAEKQGFNITLERSFDPTAGDVDVFPQEIMRVLLNLISNGFYAATKRKAVAADERYEPTLTAATKNLGDRVEIRIRDNGTGIPPEVKDKMFNPFFTTKPAGEGTGLGLSLSHDIVVKQHAGAIEVDTEPGEYTEFRIILPRIAATLAKTGDRA